MVSTIFTTAFKKPLSLFSIHVVAGIMILPLLQEKTTDLSQHCSIAVTDPRMSSWPRPSELIESANMWLLLDLLGGRHSLTARILNWWTITLQLLASSFHHEREPQYQERHVCDDINWTLWSAWHDPGTSLGILANKSQFVLELVW